MGAEGVSWIAVSGLIGGVLVMIIWLYIATRPLPTANEILAGSSALQANPTWTPSPTPAPGTEVFYGFAFPTVPSNVTPHMITSVPPTPTASQVPTETPFPTLTFTPTP